jgi:hypothetical protein
MQLGASAYSIAGGVMPARIWKDRAMNNTPTLAAQIEALANEYRPTMDNDVLHSWAADVQKVAPAIVTSLRQAEAYPQHIGDLHLGDRRSDGERLCSHDHPVMQGHPLYWPQQISQYDDSDPCCLEHAIERYADHSSGYPEPLRQAEAAPGVVEAAEPFLREIDRLEREYDFDRPDTQGQCMVLPLIDLKRFRAAFQALARQHGAREQWHPIESAPVGKAVLVFVPQADQPSNLPRGTHLIAYQWDSEGVGRNDWRYATGDGRGRHAGYPTHWMPLPAAPATDVGEGV